MELNMLGGHDKLTQVGSEKTLNTLHFPARKGMKGFLRSISKYYLTQPHSVPANSFCQTMK